MHSHPVADREAATILGKALRRVGYSEPSVRDVLGDDAYSGHREDAPVFDRRLPETRLATVIRLFFLRLPVAERDAVRALGRSAVQALEATALAAVEDEVLPRARILPIDELLVASDDYQSGEEPSDYVAAYTPTTQVCESLTPHHRVARALDVGSGSGVQALLAAGHAKHVVATDVNLRALAYTDLNAALNGLTNVECRPGSLFEPVAGERFDLVTCNAPYVVSPENRWSYRDSGLQADEISERIVRAAADHLTEGGFATLLVSWVAEDEDAPDERALAWTKGLDCDSWILPVWGADPLDHAATWNVDQARNTQAFSAALDNWTHYLEGLGVRWVTEGAILLHRHPGGRHTARVDEVDEDALTEAGDQVQRAFAARIRLSELKRPADLVDARLSVATTLQLEHELRPRRGRPTLGEARVQLAEGTSSTVDATTGALEVIASLDGSARLKTVVRATAARLRLSKAEAARLQRDALKVTRALLELGALRFHEE